MKKAQLLDTAKTLYSDDEFARLSAAVEFAALRHRGQKRMSGEPYLIHPLSVAAILIEWGMDVDTVIAGVLHDVVEDTATDLLEIESQFGRDVAFLVDGVTKVSRARSGMRDISSYLPETKDNLTKLLIAVGQDVRVIIIKLADRLHNMRTLQYMPADKQLKIARETLEVFAPIADRINMGRTRVQLEELSFSYLEPKRFKNLSRAMKDRLGKSHRKLAMVRHTIDKELDKHGIEHTMDGRIKSVYSLHKKLAKIENIDDIYDLIALRIVVDDKDTCYRVLSLLHEIYKPKVDRIKDYIARPKINGYQSLHTTVATPGDHMVEFQVRTHEMHDYAERGLAASFHYNEQKVSEDYRKGRLQALPANLSWITDLQYVAAKLRAGKEVSMEKLKLNLFGDKIFVYSPKGDIYDLPAGSFPLDFAYRIHSDIAKHASGFKVNGKIVPFDRALNDGDTIEVLTKRSIQAKLSWLNIITSPHAREKLKAQLKKLTPGGH